MRRVASSLERHDGRAASRNNALVACRRRCGRVARRHVGVDDGAPFVTQRSDGACTPPTGRSRTPPQVLVRRGAVGSGTTPRTLTLRRPVPSSSAGERSARRSGRALGAQAADATAAPRTTPRLTAVRHSPLHAGDSEACRLPPSWFGWGFLRQARRRAGVDRHDHRRPACSQSTTSCRGDEREPHADVARDLVRRDSERSRRDRVGACARAGAARGGKQRCAAPGPSSSSRITVHVFSRRSRSVRRSSSSVESSSWRASCGNAPRPPKTHGSPTHTVPRKRRESGPLVMVLGMPQPEPEGQVLLACAPARPN